MTCNLNKAKLPKPEKYGPEVFAYLIELRDSQKTNMWGASPYVEFRFGMKKKEADDCLCFWIQEMEDE